MPVILLPTLSNARRASPVLRVKAAATRLLARKESEEVQLRDTGTLGNRLGRGVVVALERELAIAAWDGAVASLLPAHPARAALPAGAVSST